jgi:hypothetical protein
MEQLERAKRYLERIRGIYSGIFSGSGHDKQSYDDDVISFFIHCYHVRDWIIHLNCVGITSSEVDKFIDSHMPLRICADLANGSKHCRLTRTLRTERQPHISGKEYRTTWYSGVDGGESMRAKYTISSYMQIHDALLLAEECVVLWDGFVEQMRLHNNAS